MDYRSFYKELCKRLNTKGEVTVTTYLEGEHRGKKEFGLSQTEDCFTECFRGKTMVVICGGGHVALAVAKIFRELEYGIILLDDREEFANQERFPMADEVRCIDFQKDFDGEQFPEQAYYVIVTRGHEHDYICLCKILNSHYRYVGMIGSRTKVAYAKKRLIEDGFTEEQIAKVHAPIGLPIGGQTPAEVAISIAAEIVQVKNQTAESILDDAVLEGLRANIPSVMVTVTKKKGSSPRGKGSRMLVLENGKIYGTIGGGTVEYAAAQKAMSLCGTQCFEQAVYDLSNGDAATLGMVCGGQVEVMFEPLGNITS